MITNEYSIAYTQVLEVLKGLSRKEFNKIPKERIEFYEKNKSINYKFKLDKTKNINDQISDTAQAILANLFVKFIATQEDKKQIYEKEKQEYISKELIKRENLQINPLFKNTLIDNTCEEKSLTIIQKKGFFEKLFIKIKQLFKIGKI